MLIRRQDICIWRRLFISAGVAAVFLLCSAAIFASTLDDYQGRIVNARATVYQLVDSQEDAKNIGDDEKSLTALIRKSVPRSEKLDWPGGSIDTDNAWLHDDLDSFAAEVNRAKRTAFLMRIGERLESIGQKITEIQTATAGDHSKDDDKRKLAEILGREEYRKPEAADESLFQRLKRKIWEWLAKMFPAVDIQPSEPSAGLGSLATVLQVLLYLGLAAAIGFVLYKFLPFFSTRFGKRAKRSKDDRVILGERIADDQSSSDLFAEAERLARDGELRLAIRKGYIALLCELSDRRVIGLARHKTNRDYLRDLRSRRELFENVSGLTGSFERHWYGSEASAEQDWEEFRTLYRQTVRGV